MRLGISARCFADLTIEEMARKTSEMGFDSIQLSLPDTIFDIDTSFGRLNPGMANHIRETFRRYGIQIAVIECYINPVIPDEYKRKRQIEMFKESIRYARDFGCSAVATETGSLNTDFSFNPENHSENTFQVLLRSLNEMVEEAEKFGIKICIEGVKPYVAYSPERIRRMLDEIGSNNLQVLLDPVNLMDMDNYQHQDRIIKESFDLFGDRIQFIHAKDFLIENGRYKMVKAGEGMLNYELLFSLAKAKKPYIDIIMDHTEQEITEITDKGINFLKIKYKNA